MVVDPDREQLSAELLEAFTEASEYVGGAHVAGAGEHRWRPQRWLVWLVAVAVAVLAVAYYPTVGSQDTPATPRLEADLRWAVANVVRQVEVSRQRQGRLPEAADLYGLLSDAVTYEPSETGYRVTGTYGSVQVVYDGAQPLEEWAAERTHGVSPPR